VFIIVWGSIGKTYNNIIENIYMRFSRWNDCKMSNASDQPSYRDYTVNIIIGIKMKAPKAVDSSRILIVAVPFERYFIIHTVTPPDACPGALYIYFINITYYFTPLSTNSSRYDLYIESYDIYKVIDRDLQ